MLLLNRKGPLVDIRHYVALPSLEIRHSNKHIQPSQVFKCLDEDRIVPNLPLKARRSRAILRGHQSLPTSSHGHCPQEWIEVGRKPDLHLNKKGGQKGDKPWQRRFFVLAGSQLVYYKTSEDYEGQKEAAGVVPLSNAYLIDKSATKRPLCFQICCVSPEGWK